MADKEMIAGLPDWCRAKAACNTSVDSDVNFNILGEFLGGFAKFEPQQAPTTLLLRCYDPVREELEKAYPSDIWLSDRMKWATEGWHWTDVQLAGAIPMETCKKLIDDSYEIVLNGFDDTQKTQVALLARKLSPAALLDELISAHGLAARRAEILKLARTGILLKTLPSDAQPTRTHIGGEPSLPDDLPWPKHSSGKPLAFLAQVDLAEIAAVAKLPGLPAAGLLCLFSVWGWLEPGGVDPMPPRGKQSDDWTQVFYVDPSAIPAKPRKTPSKLQTFPSVSVQPISITCLPCCSSEPAIEAMGFSESDAQQIADVGCEYSNLLGYQLGQPPRHLFLGYADYVQDITPAVQEQNLALLFQVASDNHTMCWGDGGYLYFFIKPENLDPLDLYGVVGDYQSG